MAISGYTQCACRDCFDTAVSSDITKPELCNDCEEAGCDADGKSECERSDAYGADDDQDACPDCGGGDFHYRGCPSQL